MQCVLVFQLLWAVTLSSGLQWCSCFWVISSPIYHLQAYSFERPKQNSLLPKVGPWWYLYFGLSPFSGMSRCTCYMSPGKFCHTIWLVPKGTREPKMSWEWVRAWSWIWVARHPRKAEKPETEYSQRKFYYNQCFLYCMCVSFYYGHGCMAFVLGSKTSK